MSEARQSIHVVQVSFVCDPERRDPETLLRVWPTLLGVAAATARAGVQVTVVQAASRDQTIHRDGVCFEFVDDARAMPRRVAGRIRIVRRPARVLRRVAQLAPDVVHLNGLVLPFAARQLREAVPRAPLLVQDHASGAPSGVHRPLWRWAFGRYDAALFAAREQVLPFVVAGTFPRSMPTFEVFEGSTYFTPGDRDEARRRTGLSGDPCILWTGRLDANKDPLVALDAFERAAQSLLDARLWCCFGAAPLLEQVERRIADSKVLRDRVFLVGRRHPSEMEDHYRAADLFVQPSHREGCSYSTIEALACGVAPLVSDIPSMRRIVGEAGALVPVGDARGLAAAMISWAAREPAARRAAARARFESALSFDIIGRELRVVYESLLAQR